jgi:hypothetical protein
MPFSHSAWRDLLGYEEFPERCYGLVTFNERIVLT